MTKYASTQVQLPMVIASALRTVGKKIPDEHLAEDGRESDAHVTLKYGLHSDDPSEVKKALAGEGPIKIKLGKTSIFPNGESDSGDVVKVDVDSPDLHRLNGIVGKLPHTDTHPDYKPHATIAYVKPGKGKQYEGDDTLDGHEFTVDEVVFSASDGKRTTIKL